jgi:hypothetical protein
MEEVKVKNQEKVFLRGASLIEKKNINNKKYETIKMERNVRQN